MSSRCYRAIVMGASAGGMETLATVLSCLDKNFPLPVLVVQHLHDSDRGRFAQHIDKMVVIRVSSACDKQKIKPCRVYFAPANYHLLVEQEEFFSINIDPPINWSRPSIDVLFKSAARVWEEHLVGVILTGSQYDGAAGLNCIAQRGGLTIVQEPDTAEKSEMPKAAIKAARVDHVLPPSRIGEFLNTLPACTKK
ncbi:MAG: chemotaxis protein CheB [Thermodesulfobacteriota bacterium]